VVVRLVGLDRPFVEERGLFVAALAAEPRERVVSHDRERLARELPGRDARDRALEAEQPLEQRAPALRERIVRARVDAELREALLDQAVVPGLVARLAGERELDRDLARRRQPRGGALGRLELVLEGEHQEARDGQVVGRVALGRRARDPIEGGAVQRVELGHERFGGGHVGKRG
jgi:hypothetical protein